MFPHCVDDTCFIFGQCTCPLPNEQDIVSKAGDALLPQILAEKFPVRPDMPLPLGFGSKLCLITLTKTVDDPQSLIDVWSKIISSRAIGVVKAIGCIELTEAELPHMHIMCEITGRAVKRDIQKWNGDFVDVRKVTPTFDSVDTVRKYILKDVDNQDLINYLNLKKVSQFYYKNIDALQA